MSMPAFVLLVPAGLVVIGLFLDGLKRRGRLAALPVLAPADDPGDGYRLIAVAGVTVPDDVRRAAVAYAREHGVEALDLVPADLPVVEAYRLADAVDPATYRTSRLNAGRTAEHAVVVAEALLDRAAVTHTSNLDPVGFIRLTRRLKKYAPAGLDLAVAPGLRAVPADPATRKARLRGSDGLPALTLGAAAVAYGVLVASVLAYPMWGWIALVGYSLQPYLVLAGTPLRARDRHVRAWLRLVAAPLRWWREIRGTWRSAYDADLDALREQAREEYVAELAEGIDRFFEPRRDTCPWCGERRLSVRVRTKDRIQVKPGRFVLDECRACGHIFQNPRLSIAGLDFYYRDAYDRFGEAGTDIAFGLANDSAYRGRTDMVRRFTTPRHWLDVGAGHGHFCIAATGLLPDTIFDGLDMSDSIEEAQRRGWVSTGHRGQFPDLADKLADTYDVVSMHHYLEHTRDPRAELDAAARVVAPGGYLLIEVPNPTSWLGRILRGYWLPWYQPQHLNLVPLPNLEDALRGCGFEPVAAEVGPAHLRVDYLAAVVLFINSVAPDPDRPWAPTRPTRMDRFRRALLLVAGIPFILAALLMDAGVGVAVRRGRGGNAYRVVARRV